MSKPIDKVAALLVARNQELQQGAATGSVQVVKAASGLGSGSSLGASASAKGGAPGPGLRAYKSVNVGKTKEAVQQGRKLDKFITALYDKKQSGRMDQSAPLGHSGEGHHHHHGGHHSPAREEGEGEEGAQVSVIEVPYRAEYNLKASDEAKLVPQGQRAPVMRMKMQPMGVSAAFREALGKDARFMLEKLDVTSFEALYTPTIRVTAVNVKARDGEPGFGEGKNMVSAVIPGSELARGNGSLAAPLELLPERKTDARIAYFMEHHGDFLADPKGARAKAIVPVGDTDLVNVHCGHPAYEEYALDKSNPEPTMLGDSTEWSTCIGRAKVEECVQAVEAMAADIAALKSVMDLELELTPEGSIDAITGRPVMATFFEGALAAKKQLYAFAPKLQVVARYRVYSPKDSTA